MFTDHHYKIPIRATTAGVAVCLNFFVIICVDLWYFYHGEIAHSVHVVDPPGWLSFVTSTYVYVSVTGISNNEN